MYLYVSDSAYLYVLYVYLHVLYVFMQYLLVYACIGQPSNKLEGIDTWMQWQIYCILRNQSERHIDLKAVRD